MAIIFSPINQTELVDPFQPLPRTAFVMRQLGAVLADADQLLVRETNAALKRAGFAAVTASDVRGTTDFLQKIIDLIRGCGFSIAIFSDKTPAKALANIFFEVGIASVLGKPVQLVMTGTNPAPSDFVRTEWISYDTNDLGKLRADLKRSLKKITELGDFYRRIGDVALQGASCDYELAFERYRQAVLISDEPVARKRIGDVKRRLAMTAGGVDMASHRSRLDKAITEFLALLPPARKARRTPAQKAPRR